MGWDLDQNSQLESECKCGLDSRVVWWPQGRPFCVLAQASKKKKKKCDSESTTSHQLIKKLPVSLPPQFHWKCRRCQFDLWVGRISQRSTWKPTPVFLPEKSHGQRSLADHGLWGQKESDMTGQLSTVPNKGFPGGSVVKNLPANAGDMGSIPGSGISPGERNGNPLQSSCLENTMDRGAWWATVHGVKESDTTY